jgi:hypothetical protein
MRNKWSSSVALLAVKPKWTYDEAWTVMLVWEASGLSKTEFFDMCGVNPQRLRYWLKRR